MAHVLAFERPVVELVSRVRELRALASTDEKWAPELERLEEKAARLAREVFANLSPMQKVQLSRHPNRPYTSDYVSRLFDYYAPTFEEHLTERLHYQGPEVLGRALRQATEGAATNVDVIDLGCGTGLCGIEFRAIARRLIGIDLSQKMLDLAAKRNAMTNWSAGTSPKC